MKYGKNCVQEEIAKKPITFNIKIIYLFIYLFIYLILFNNYLKTYDLIWYISGIWLCKSEFVHAN